MGAIIITGYTGTRHIKPSMDAAIYRGAFGNDNYVLNEDDACAGSMPSVNEFVVADGCVSMQGHAVQIKRETLSVDTCATGYARIDLVCVRFNHNTSSLIDGAELVVIKGDEVSDSNTPTPPAYSEGVIDEGAVQVDFPLYQIEMHGGTVTFTQVFTLVASLEDCTLTPETIAKWDAILGNTVSALNAVSPQRAGSTLNTLETATIDKVDTSDKLDTASLDIADKDVVSEKTEDI